MVKVFMYGCYLIVLHLFASLLFLHVQILDAVASCAEVKSLRVLGQAQRVWYQKDFLSTAKQGKITSNKVRLLLTIEVNPG